MNRWLVLYKRHSSFAKRITYQQLLRDLYLISSMWNCSNMSSVQTSIQNGLFHVWLQNFLLPVGGNWPLKCDDFTSLHCERFILFHSILAVLECPRADIAVAHGAKQPRLFNVKSPPPKKKRRKRSSVMVLIVDGSHFLLLRQKAVPTNPFCQMPTAHGNHHIIILLW